MQLSFSTDFVVVMLLIVSEHFRVRLPLTLGVLFLYCYSYIAKHALNTVHFETCNDLLSQIQCFLQKESPDKLHRLTKRAIVKYNSTAWGKFSRKTT